MNLALCNQEKGMAVIPSTVTIPNIFYNILLFWSLLRQHMVNIVLDSQVYFPC